MADVQLTDLAAANGQYTFIFASNGAFKTSPDDAVAQIAAANLPISDVRASYTGGVFGTGLFSATLTVSFTWTQSGWTIKQVAQNLEGALDSGTLGNYNYVQGAGGLPPGTLLDKLKSALGEKSSAPGEANGLTTGTLLVVGAVALLVYFSIIFTRSTAQGLGGNVARRVR